MKSDYQILFGGYTNTFFNSKGGSPRKKKKKNWERKSKEQKDKPAIRCSCLSSILLTTDIDLTHADTLPGVVAADQFVRLRERQVERHLNGGLVHRLPRHQDPAVPLVRGGGGRGVPCDIIRCPRCDWSGAVDEVLFWRHGGGYAVSQCIYA